MVSLDRIGGFGLPSGKGLATPVLVAGALVLSGCSSVPDAINPAEWYKSTVELFSGDETADENAQERLKREQEVAAAAGQEQTAKSYPRVSDVEKQRRARNLGLSADPDRPRYAPAIPRQDQTQAQAAIASPPPAPAQPSPTATAVVPQRGAPVPAAPQLTQPKQTLTPPSDDQLAKTVPGVPQVSIPSRAQQEAEYVEHQARMRKHLEDLLAAAQKEPDFVRPTGLPAGVGVGETVVIGGSGVVDQSPAAASGGSGSLGGAAGAWPLPAGAQHVATIVFPNGSARLTGKDRRILAQIVQLQRERGGALRIVGHSSSRTRNLSPARHQAVNYKVSALRAKTVARELVRQGANRKSVQTAALSDSRPLYRENMPNGEAGNRRAEIFLVN